VDEKFIWEGFERGAPVILVSGCHIGDCHYIDANHWTEKRVKKVRKKMEKLGIQPERLQLEWISAAEGVRFAQVMQRMEILRRQVTADEIAQTIQILKNQREKKS
jgi:heterodisulfide reductase subunit A